MDNFGLLFFLVLHLQFQHNHKTRDKTTSHSSLKIQSRFLRKYLLIPSEVILEAALGFQNRSVLWKASACYPELFSGAVEHTNYQQKGTARKKGIIVLTLTKSCIYCKYIRTLNSRTPSVPMQTSHYGFPSLSEGSHIPKHPFLSISC